LHLSQKKLSGIIALVIPSWQLINIEQKLASSRAEHKRIPTAFKDEAKNISQLKQPTLNSLF